MNIRRKTILYFFITSFFCFFPVFGEQEAIEFSFLELSSGDLDPVRNGQVIEIRGFLYETVDSQVILAAEPNLKSCCVGSDSKKQKQMLVSGNIFSALDDRSAVTLRGNLDIRQGDKFPYQLSNAIVVEANYQSFEMLAFFGVFVFLILGYLSWGRFSVNMQKK